MRSQGGRWLLRIDDLDRERCIVGLAEHFQSDRIDSYASAVTALQSCGRSYPCHCSRASIAATQVADPASEQVYPGTCREDLAAGSQPYALRLRIDQDNAIVEFEDSFQGLVRQDCMREAGDFVIQRRDGPFANHLAVVVDDERQGVTEVVRGADLLSSTPRQILLQRCLGFRTPRYGHLPVLLEPDGRKLAKSRRAVPLVARDAPHQLWQVLNWLEQAPPAALSRAPIREIWSWSIANWRPERLEGRLERRLEDQVAQ